VRRRVLVVLAGILALQSTNLLAAERVALVIGNGAYKHASVLDNPPKDVKLVSSALKDVGFEVTTLIDADIDAMDLALLNFGKKIDRSGPDTIGLFYYAGHGITYNGKNWLIPVDAQVTDGAHVRRRTLSAQDILGDMETRKNKTNIMILDACRDTPFPEFQSGTRAVRAGMAEMNAPEGSFVAFSTAAGRVAYDGEGNYSPFAEAFAGEIPTPNVAINTMMIRVNARVRKSTENLGATPQVPWVNHSLSEDFWFNPRANAGSTEPKPTPVRQDPVPRKKSQEELEDQMWGDIKDSGDPQEYSVFLKQFPDGRYAGIAKARQTRFGKKPAVVNRPDVDAKPPAGPEADPAMVTFCRQYAGGDSANFAECMAEINDPDSGDDWEDYDDGFDARSITPNIPGNQAGGIVWFDDEQNQWQVILNGAFFTATANVPGTGVVKLQGQSAGTEVSYGIFNNFGQQIGYGGGNIVDQSHIAVTSYWANGTVLGSTQFHVNHRPQ
jgi:hypothetical protein